MDAGAAEFCTPAASVALPLAVWSALGVLLLGYASGVRATRRTGHRWPGWKTAAFAAGVATLALAFVPAAPTGIRGHMVAHVLVGMIAPIGIVLGCPATLALRVLPKRAARAVARVLRGRAIQVLAHPLTAAALNVGGLAALYLTPWYARTLTHPGWHTFIHVHVFLSGCLFTWAVASPEGFARRARLGLRLGALALAAAAHATLAKLMYAHGWPRGTPDPRAEIEAAAQLMYYGGDVAEVLLATVLLAGWYRSRRRAPVLGSLPVVPPRHAPGVTAA